MDLFSLILSLSIVCVIIFILLLVVFLESKNINSKKRLLKATPREPVPIFKQEVVKMEEPGEKIQKQIKEEKLSSYWNYRILAHKEEDKSWLFQIHEVHYNKDGTPDTYTKEPVPVVGETIKDIDWALQKMRHSLDNPILSAEKFPKPWLGR